MHTRIASTQVTDSCWLDIAFGRAKVVEAHWGDESGRLEVILYAMGNSKADKGNGVLWCRGREDDNNSGSWRHGR